MPKGGGAISDFPIKKSGQVGLRIAHSKERHKTMRLILVNLETAVTASHQTIAALDICCGVYDHEVAFASDIRSFNEATQNVCIQDLKNLRHCNGISIKAKMESKNIYVMTDLEKKLIAEACSLRPLSRPKFFRINIQQTLRNNGLLNWERRMTDSFNGQCHTDRNTAG